MIFNDLECTVFKANYNCYKEEGCKDLYLS